MQHKVVCQGLWLFTWLGALSSISKHRNSQPSFSHMGQLQKGWWAVTAGAPGMLELKQRSNKYDAWKRKFTVERSKTTERRELVYFWYACIFSLLYVPGSFISKIPTYVFFFVLLVVVSPLHFLCTSPRQLGSPGMLLRRIRRDLSHMVCCCWRCHAFFLYPSCISAAHTSFWSTSEQGEIGKSWQKPFKPTSYQTILSTVW